MPPELYKFLKLIKNKLYYSDDDIIIFEEANLLEKEGFTISELKQIREFLKEKNIIEKDNFFYAFHKSTLPVNYKSKKRVLEYPGFIGFLFPGLSKMWIALKIKSEKDFLNFYKGEEKSDLPPSQVNYDLRSKVITCGNKTYKVRSEKRIKLFETLWSHKHEAMPKEAILVQVGKIEFNRDCTKKDKEWLDNQISQFNRTFKDKGFPLFIKREKEIQLIEEYK